MRAIAGRARRTCRGVGTCLEIDDVTEPGLAFAAKRNIETLPDMSYAAVGDAEVRRGGGATDAYHCCEGHNADRCCIGLKPVSHMISFSSPLRGELRSL